MGGHKPLQGCAQHRTGPAAGLEARPSVDGRIDCFGQTTTTGQPALARAPPSAANREGMQGGAGARSTTAMARTARAASAKALP